VNPFGAGQPDVLSHRVRNEEPDLSVLVEPLATPVRRALSKDPGQRPTAVEVLSELTGGWAATRVEPVAAAHPTEIVPGLLATEWRGIPAPETRRVRRKRSGTWVAAGAAALALVLAGGVFVWPGNGVPSLGLPGMGLGGGAGVTTAGGEGRGNAGDAGSGGEGVDSALAAETDPENWEAVLSQAIDSAKEVESFEAYQRNTTADEHGQFLVHRYTNDPEPVLYQGHHGGPAYHQFLAVGGDLMSGEGVERLLGRAVMDRPPGVPDDPNPYGRDPEPVSPMEYAAQFGSGEWTFLWYPSLLLEAESEADVTYQGVTEAVQPDAAWSRDHFDTEPAHGAAHYYSGTFLRWSPYTDAEDDAPGIREYVFDLWIGEDGRFQRFEHYREISVDGTDTFEGAEGWEVVAISYDEPVTIDVPDESEVLPTPAPAY
jgi:eukaryotic-like serine/threonine-protein kinase